MPAETLPPYVDGWLGNERESSVIPKPQFPFAKNPTPDTYSRLYERNYFVEPRLFLPKIASRTAWTNLLTYSEQLDNAAWTKTNLTATANAATAPDGQTTLDKLLETVTNAEHSVTQAATVTAAPTEVSVFAVGGLTRLWIRLAYIDSAATTFSAFFNIASGYLGTKSAGVTAKIVALGNNQFRCVIQFTPAAGAGTFKANVSTDGATISYAGTIANGVYLWGAQVTTGTETPYISTTSATRAISAPDRDKVDPMAYLIDEDDPNIETSASGAVRRVFGRIPNSQTIPGALFVTKPDVPGTFPQVFGTFRIFQPVSTVASYDAYAAQVVTSDSGAVSSFYPTGGTYTLSFGGSTTGALNYNDVLGTVQTALNALTPISNRGNVVVSGTYNSAAGFLVTFNTYAAATLNTGSLTTTAGATILAAITLANGGYSQIVRVTASFGNAGLSCASSFGPSNANPMQYGYDIGSVTDFSIAMGSPSYVTPATSGTFTITVFGQTTAAIAFNASAATIQAAINALSNVSAKGGYTVYDIGIGNGVQLYHLVLTPVVFTGGTFTITIFGQTTAAIAYNASISTIAAALNALTNVQNRGNCSIFGIGGSSAGIGLFTVTFQNAAINPNTASLTPTSSHIEPLITDGGVGRVQTLVFSAATTSRTLAAQAHGMVAADTLYIKGDASYLADIVDFTVADANTLVVNASPGSLIATASTISEVGKRTTAAYAPGSALTRVNRVTAFYLPGVSAGITTADDIALPTYQGDPSTLLAAIFARDTAINYQVGELEQWRGPILQRTITTLNATQL